MIQSVHGVPLPPRKQYSHSKCVTIRFVITGTIPSKKNRMLATMNWNKIFKALVTLFVSGGGLTVKKVMAILSDNKPFVRQSEKYKEWEKVVKPILAQQAAKNLLAYRSHGLEYPIRKASISVYHYWKDNLTRDNSNKCEGIHDMLVSLNIIRDDTWQCLFRTKSEANIYPGQLLDHITVVELTAYEW